MLQYEIFRVRAKINKSRKRDQSVTHELSKENTMELSKQHCMNKESKKGWSKVTSEGDK